MKISKYFYKEVVETGLQEYEEKYKQIMFRNITRKAKEIGYELVSVN